MLASYLVLKRFSRKSLFPRRNKHVEKSTLCCIVVQSVISNCDPVDFYTLGFPVLHHLWSLLKHMSTESVMPSNHLILFCPLLFLPSIFPSVRVISNKSTLRIRWPKYWSFSFSINHSKEYSVLISFRIDWFDLLAA